MILFGNKIMGTKVLHNETGETLAFLHLPIIEPDTGVILGFWLKPRNSLLGHAVIRTAEILSFGKSLHVKSSKSVVQAVDIINITHVLEDGRKFLGTKVENETGEYFGRIYDMSFSTESYVLKQIFCSRFLGIRKRIFAYERILRVLPGKVIIDDDMKNKVRNLSMPTEVA